MQLPIGTSDFKSIIDDGFYFVDKSLLIKEVIEDTQAILITRPRRFGKTLNMSMLRYFLDLNANAADLFKNLKIAKEKEFISQHQGQYPIIYLTFKDVKSSSFSGAYEKIKLIIQSAYDQYSVVLLKSDKLTSFQKRKINAILEDGISQPEIEESLLTLSKCLHDHYGKKICILLDEYDTPIQMGYLKNYYDEVAGFFRNLLGAVLKDNPYLFKAVLTGILRVSKESMFSDLNNLIVYSVLSRKYGDYFGFTESEVRGLLSKAGLQEKSAEIKNWYNGYQFGDHRVYNPWSMVNCVTAQGVCDIYWINTSGNDLVKELLIESNESFKTKLEPLFEGQTISCLIDENVVFPDLKLKDNESAIWSLFLMAGYLTADSIESTERGPLCQLRIPNREIRGLYRRTIENWLAAKFDIRSYDAFIDYLIDGNIDEFEKNLRNIMEQIVSVHDVSHSPESFYHGLLIGLTASLGGRKEYALKSNRESGYGRYDYMILSHLKDKPTIVFEFKQINLSKKKSAKEIKMILEKSAKEGLQQIDSHVYLAEARQHGAGDILKIGLAFSGKRFSLVDKREVIVQK